MARKPRKAVGPMYIGRVIPEHVKDPRAPVDKSRVLIPGVTGQIPQLLRIAVKLHKGASLFEAGLNLGLGESSRLSPVN